jgi:hypothetical protein
MSDLITQINQVRRLREVVLDQKKAIDWRMGEWAAENEMLLKAQERDKKELAEAEDTLRKLTLEAYQADPSNKKPALGVGIKIVKEAVYSPKVAFAWALAHETCLVLDTKAYEALMKAGQDVPGTLEEVAQATISKEL